MMVDREFWKGRSVHINEERLERVVGDGIKQHSFISTMEGDVLTLKVRKLKTDTLCVKRNMINVRCLWYNGGGVQGTGGR